MTLKEELLEHLENSRGSPLSGQALADRFGVSRAAVWKAVKALEADGHRIAAAKRGYQLEAESDVLSPQGLRRYLPPAFRNCPIRAVASVDSTNTLAKRLAADGAPDGTILLAEEQTAGRGRMGRSFYSPARDGLYMSVLLRPQMRAQELTVVTIAAAAAVCEAVEALTDLRTQIKWVNDILVDGRKISGILTEGVTDFESGMADSVIIGIGVNVRTPPALFPEDLRGIAGSLWPAPVSRNELAAEILRRLLAYVRALPRRDFLEPYRRRSVVLGKPLLFSKGGKWTKGRAAAIDSDGRLLIQAAEQEILLNAGEIKLEGFP